MRASDSCDTGATGFLMLSLAEKNRMGLVEIVGTPSYGKLLSSLFTLSV